MKWYGEKNDKKKIRVERGWEIRRDEEGKSRKLKEGGKRKERIIKGVGSQVTAPTDAGFLRWDICRGWEDCWSQW